MASVEKISIALPPEMISTVREKSVEELRKLWQQALEDKSPGVSPHDVFDRLERKYQALAHSS